MSAHALLRLDRPLSLRGAETMPMPSYTSGPSDVPLLGETIGENLRRTVERFGDREALVVRHQDYRATYARALGPGRPGGARASSRDGVAKGDRVGIWAPNRYEWVVTQFADRAHRRDPRHDQPGLQGGRAAPTRSTRPA